MNPNQVDYWGGLCALVVVIVLFITESMIGPGRASSDNSSNEIQKTQTIQKHYIDDYRRPIHKPTLNRVIVALRHPDIEYYKVYHEHYAIAISRDTTLLKDSAQEHTQPIYFRILTNTPSPPLRMGFSIQVKINGETRTVPLPPNFAPKFITDYHGYYVAKNKHPQIPEIIHHLTTTEWPRPEHKRTRPDKQTKPRRPSKPRPIDMDWFTGKEFLRS